MCIDEFLGASYKLVESKNFDELLKELGVGMVMRKLGESVSPTVTLTKTNDLYTFSTSSSFKNTRITFMLNEEFADETLDGRHVKSTITTNGDKLIQHQKGDVSTEIVREFSEKSLVATIKVNNIVSVRKYIRI